MIIFGLLWILGITNAASYIKGGSDWGDKCVASSLKRQSPIDLEDFKGACDNTIHLDLTLPFANHTFVAETVDDPGYIQVRSTNGTFGYMYATDLSGKIYGYNGKRVVAHAPSEHHIDGVSYDLELQIEMDIIPGQFAKEDEGKSAIISLLFAKSDVALKMGIFELFMATEEKIDNFNITIGAYLPSPLIYFAYQGSATKPDCKESVNWYVVQEPLLIDETQLLAFTSKYAGNTTFAGGRGNNRKIQSVNNRKIKKGGVECEE